MSLTKFYLSVLENTEVTKSLDCDQVSQLSLVISRVLDCSSIEGRMKASGKCSFLSIQENGEFFVEKKVISIHLRKIDENLLFFIGKAGMPVCLFCL